MRKSRRRDEGGVLYDDAMMELIFLLEAPQYGDRFLDGGLTHVDRLETTLQGGVLFDVLPVLVEGRGAYAAQLAPGEGRFEHIRRVDRALRAPGADDGVELIDKQDDSPRRLVDLFEDGLEPVLELTTVLRSREQGTQVEGEDALVLQGLRDISGYDPLGETFHDGRLAHAGLADDDRVVLCPARQDLHDPADLLVAADDGVKLALAGLFRQVPAVALERLVFFLRGLVGHPLGAPQVFEDRVDAVLCYAVYPESGRRRSILPVGYADEEVFGAHELVLEPFRFRERRVEGLLEARRYIGLAHAFHARYLGKFAVEVAGYHVRLDAELFQYGPYDPIFLRYEGKEQVLVLDALLAQRLGLLLRLLDGLLGLYGQFLPVHMFTS